MDNIINLLPLRRGRMKVGVDIGYRLISTL